MESSSGVAGGYALGVGASLPPLLLEDDEALAVTLGLRTATMGSVAGIEEAALRALTKIEQVLPSRLRRRVKALGEAVSPLYFGSARVDATRLSMIAGASRDFERANPLVEQIRLAQGLSVQQVDDLFRLAATL